VEYYAYGGDFGEKYFDNFTIKGIVNADGTPKGVMNECKRVFQPIECEWMNKEKRLIRITNRSAVKNTNAYNALLLIKEDGFVTQTKELSIAIAPGRDTILNITEYLPALKPDVEYHVAVRFDLKNDVSWAYQGFDIASSQLLLQKATINLHPLAASVLTVMDEKTGITVTGTDFTIGFSKTVKGGLNSYLYKGTQQVQQVLLPHFTRPLTDNDKRGWKAQRKLKQWYNDDLKLINTSVDKKNDRIVVNCFYSLVNDSAKVKVMYSISNEGVIKINYSLQVKPGLPNIPKVGMQMGIERDYSTIEWFGKGSMENYIDKNYGADESGYRLPLDQFMENYVVPQENGNRTDVRWMFLSNKQKDGLLVIADSLLSMSAWPYTEENIRDAKHTNKLKDAGFITLNIDLVQMGVGGNDSWSDVAAPLEQYQIKAKDYQYAFYIVPYNAKDITAGEAAKTIKF
jgi:beta-galactosidase